MNVDVLLVNYLTDELTSEAATRLSPVARVLVWDNSGGLSSRDLPAGVELLGCGENVLYAAASNILYEASEAPYVLLLNPDALADADHLVQLVAELDADAAAWGVAPRLVGLDDQDQNYRRRLPTLGGLIADRLLGRRWPLTSAYDHFYCRDLDPAEVGRAEQPAAACLLIRRQSVGSRLFDESYPLFGNDTDLARRLNADGHCAYAAGVVVRHVGGASIGQARARDKGWIRSEYDKALRTYSRRHVRGSIFLEPAFAARLLLHRMGRHR